MRLEYLKGWVRNFSRISTHEHKVKKFRDSLLNGKLDISLAMLNKFEQEELPIEDESNKLFFWRSLKHVYKVSSVSGHHHSSLVDTCKTEGCNTPLVLSANFGNYDLGMSVWEKTDLSSHRIHVDEEPLCHRFESGKQYTVSAPIFRDSRTRARWVKSHPEVWAAGHRYVVWLDSNVLLTGEWGWFFDKFIESQAPMGTFKHPFRANISEELEAVRARGKISNSEFQVWKQKITGHEYPNLWETNVCFFDTHHPKLRELLGLWWHYQHSLGGNRDQLSLPIAAEETGIDIHIIGNGSQSCRLGLPFSMVQHGDLVFFDLAEKLRSVKRKEPF